MHYDTSSSSSSIGVQELITIPSTGNTTATSLLLLIIIAMAGWSPVAAEV